MEPVVNTRKWFYSFAGIHLFLWTLLPSLFLLNPPLDVVEGLVWGSAWQWGYDKHPWLAPWLTKIASELGGHTIWPIYLLSQLAVITCFWAIWRLGRRILTPLPALLAVVVLEGIYYYHFTTPEFNPNVLMLPMWALTCLFFHKAITTQKLTDWLCVGLFAGLAMMTKYYSALLLISMLLLMIKNQKARMSFSNRNFYAGIAIFLIIIAPNVIWLVQHNFISIHYALGRTSSSPTFWQHITHPLLFIAVQFAALVPALFIASPLLFCERQTWNLKTFDQQFLLFIGAGPFIIVTLLSLFAGIELRSMYGMPLFSLSGILFLSFIKPKITPKHLKYFAMNTVGVFAVFLIVFSITNKFGSCLSGKGKRIDFPGEQIATSLTIRWHHQFHTPLRYVAGTRWLSGNLAFFSPDHPKAYFDWSPTISTWINEKALKKSGAIFLWNVRRTSKNLPTELIKRYPHLIKLPIQTFAWRSCQKLKPISLGVAFLPPAQ